MTGREATAPRQEVAVEARDPEFSPLGDNLKVITECGVEVRLESGIIHSPIHYRDVADSGQLADIARTGYKYRPKQHCQWVIRAPDKEHKIGIKFQYFDLHPDYDRLDVEEAGEGGRAEVASFRGGERTRTIISGGDSIR